MFRKFGQDRRGGDAVQVRADAGRQQFRLGHARRQHVAAFLAFQSAEGVGQDRRGQAQGRTHVGQRRRFLGDPVVDAFGAGIGAGQVVGDDRRVVLSRVEILEHRPQDLRVADRDFRRAENRLGTAVGFERMQTRRQEAEGAAGALEPVDAGPAAVHDVDQRRMEGIGRLHAGS